MKIEVIYCGVEDQKCYRLDCKKGTKVNEAIEVSGVLDDFKEIDLGKNKIGIFSSFIRLDRVLNEGDRVEIYRDLTIDPKAARRIRAEQKRKQQGMKLFGA
ncbi:MAG: RnfH family protein [Francisellaceae bacterium]